MVERGQKVSLIMTKKIRFASPNGYLASIDMVNTLVKGLRMAFEYRYYPEIQRHIE
jgi:hypothetical protein